MATCQTCREAAAPVSFLSALAALPDDKKKKSSVLKCVYYPIMLIDAISKRFDTQVFSALVSPTWRRAGEFAKNVKNGLSATELPGATLFVIKGIWLHLFVAPADWIRGKETDYASYGKNYGKKASDISGVFTEFAVASAGKVSTLEDTFSVINAVEITKTPRALAFVKKIAPWCMALSFGFLAVKSINAFKAYTPAQGASLDCYDPGYTHHLLKIAQNISYLVVGLLGVLQACVAVTASVLAVPLCLMVALSTDLAMYFNTQVTGYDKR